MNEPFDCVSRDILIAWNISLLMNHILDRSYNLWGGAGHFVEGFIIKILIGFEDHCRKGVRYLGVIENKFHKSLMWQSWIVNTNLLKAIA